MTEYKYLVCLDMDRVLVDHLSTWQYVYDKLGISNDESFSLYNQGLLTNGIGLNWILPLSKVVTLKLQSPMNILEN